MTRVRPHAAQSARIRAFTLIELLVVVAIIALLIAILLPSLGRARDQAKTVACGSNQRGIGQAVLAYASEHEDRAPGGGTYTNPKSGKSVTQIWSDILNDEYFDGRLVIRRSSYPKRGELGCTNVQNWAPLTGSGNTTVRYYTINSYLDGSLIAASALDLGTPPGRSLHDGTAYDTYFYGAKMGWFESPQRKFMLVESECSSDGTKGPSSSVTGLPGSVTLGTATPGPAWANADLHLGFRHIAFSRANFLFQDGHVELMGPNDEVFATRRFNYRGNSGTSH
jgi:prepilin-type N-terminal cleavage/methylation domain-containing protein/prepilin-type processing-associated H-X9-DG protein